MQRSIESFFGGGGGERAPQQQQQQQQQQGNKENEEGGSVKQPRKEQQQRQQQKGKETKKRKQPEEEEDPEEETGGGKEGMQVEEEGKAETKDEAEGEEEQAKEQEVVASTKRRRVVAEDDDDDEEDAAHPAAKPQSASAPTPTRKRKQGQAKNEEDGEEEMSSKQEEKKEDDKETAAEEEAEETAVRECVPVHGDGIVQRWQLEEPLPTPLPYKVVADTFEKLEAVSSRLEMIALLTKLFCGVVANGNQEDLLAAVYLCVNKLGPNHDTDELGIGDSILIKAVAQATGRNVAAVKEKYREIGDLGNLASRSRSAQTKLTFGRPKKANAGLTAVHVLGQLRKIARIQGSGSQDQKISIIHAMLVPAADNEAKFIVRSLKDKLRIGVKETTVHVALSRTFATVPRKKKLSLWNSTNGTAAEAGSANENEEEKEDGDDDCKEEEQEREEEEEEEEEEEQVEELQDSDEEEDVAAAASGSSSSSRRPKSKSKANKSKQTTLTGGVVASGKKSAEEEAESIVRQAFSECPDYARLLEALRNHPLAELPQHCCLQPGTPIAPMLAKPSKSFEEVLAKLSGLYFTLEYKYDGERAQVHLMRDGSFRIFSRNSKDDTSKFPELLPVLQQAKHEAVVDCVIDSEVVAYDRETEQLLPFQVLSTRRRKDEDAENVKVQVILQAFDLLYLNGESLLTRTFEQRRELLHSQFSVVPGRFQFAVSVDHQENGDTAPIDAFLQEAVVNSCEGLMVKTLRENSKYQPSVRSRNWLKLKKDYLDTGMGVADSLDLVVLGAYHGRGKRTGVYGAYLLGCYDPHSEEYQSACKVGTGFSDKDLHELTEDLREHVIDRKPFGYRVGEDLSPDVWFDPVRVFEVRAADLSLSPVHKAGIGRLDPSRGIALRFPRYQRKRTDKEPEQATTAAQVVEMYNEQALTGGASGAVPGDDDDDDDDDDCDFL